MRRRFRSSLSALHAFEAAARHGSFSGAADELNLSQGAVSRQIRGLELSLGIRLFDLVKRRVVLTEVGRRYLTDVRQAIDTFEFSTWRAIGASGGDQTLELATLPTFCSRWLIPRLPLFYELQPGVVVNCTTRLKPFDFAVEPFDAAIHFGRPAWPHAILHPLFDVRLIAVCSPQFRSRHAIRTEVDLASVPLLQQLNRPSAWAEWFEKIGLQTDNAVRGARYDQISMLSQAAVNGLGAALLPQFLIEDELHSGRLVLIGQTILESAQSYLLVVPEAKGGMPLIDQFRRWLLSMVHPSAKEPLEDQAAGRR